MTIHILGAAGWIPGTNETSCIMVEHNDMLFLLDAGTGAANIKNYESVLSKYDTVHLLLSHYHLDHLIGLIYLSPFLRNKHIKIYGPGKMAYPETTDYYLHALLRNEFYSRSIDRFSQDVQIMDFPADTFLIGKTKLSVKKQLHSAASFRIAMDDKLIYATDTAFDADAWEGVSAEVLFHECWAYDQSASDRHTTLWALKNQLPLASFGKVMLIHHNPVWNSEDYEIIRQMIARTNIYLAEDGMCLAV